MASVNRVFVLGNVTKDIELRYTQSGTAVCSFSVATNEEWTDQQGQQQKETEYHDITCWKRTAEIAAKYLSRGSQVCIEGKLKTRDWLDKDTGAKRYRTEIICSRLTLLGKRDDAHSDNGYTPDPPAYGDQIGGADLAPPLDSNPLTPGS